MNENKRLTPEETLRFYCKNTFEKAGNMSQICLINAVENYAAQEVADKDMQLKEAISLLRQASTSLSIRRTSAERKHISNKIDNWIKRNGEEAGNYE